MTRISSSELAVLLATRPVALLDVRTAAELETAQIPGSIGVSLDELAAHTDAVLGTLLARLPYNRGEARDTPRITERFRQLTCEGRVVA